MLVVILAMGMMLGGCQTDAKESPEGDNAQNGETPVEEVTKKDSIIIGIGTEPSSMDALGTNEQTARQIFANVYETLVTFDEGGNAQPGIAKEWTISDDQLEYTFVLNEGIKFHNGEDLKASDVVFTLQRGMESSYVKLFYKAFEAVEEIDEYTVKITANKPTPAFLKILSLPQTSIGSEKAFSDGGENYGRTAVGSGPYEFVEWVGGDKIVLKAFEGYHGQAPAIKDCTFKFVTDKSTGMIALEKGEIDVYYGISFVDADNASNNPDLVYDQGQTMSWEQVVINYEDKHFSNKLVRQALAHAIDKESVLIAGVDGRGQLADCHVPDYMFGYTEDVQQYDYNPEKAKELLAEAGYPDGFEAHMMVNAGYREKEAQVIQANLNDVGINLIIDVYEFGALLDSVYGGEYELAISGKNLQINDPSLIVHTIYNSKMIGRPGNYFRFANQEVDKYINDAENATDDKARKEAYHSLFKTLADEVPNIPLYWKNDNVTYTSKLKGLSYKPDGVYSVKDMSW
jgi:peptide/nickel transport system substrate-binding protein